LDVAVSVTVSRLPDTNVLGARYVAAKGVLLEKVPHAAPLQWAPDNDQLTPEFELSPGTNAVKETD
jgi:hypothetical protein